MTPKILAFTGPKGCGKSTVAERMLLGSFIPQRAIRLSMADPIRAMLRQIIDPKAMKTENKENPEMGICGRSARFLLQTLGTEWGRSIIHPDIWVEAIRRKILATDAATVIIDDIRFDNEVAMVKSLGGVIVRVERDGVGYTCEHASEIPVRGEDIDYVLSNNSFEELEAAAKTWNPFA